MGNNKKKTEQLGMPFGTASAKLRKQIMFLLLGKLKENVCFHCNKEIQTVRELSIEHKISWQDNDVNLFWDLNNIAFSHLSCNVIDANKRRLEEKRKNIPLRKIGPVGTAWCTGCKNFLSTEMFSKNKARWHGWQGHCKDCSKMFY